MTGFGSAVGTLFRFELKMLLRDRRTVVASIVLPILVMPLLLFATSISQRFREVRQLERTYRYAVTGGEAGLARRLIAAYEAVEDDAPSREWTLEEVASSDPRADLDDRQLQFYVEALSAAAAEAEAEAAAAEAAAAPAGDPPTTAGEETAELPAVPLLRLVFRLNRNPSQTACWEMGRRLEAVRSAERHFLLAQRGFPVGAGGIAAVDERDLATASQRTGATIGRYATAFLLLFLLTGGSVVAADTLAGEKERGTLETVLTTAAGRRELVIAKLLVILAVGVAITVIQLLNLLFYVGLGVIPLPESFAVEPSLATIALLLLLLLPLAVLAGSSLLWLSGIARTYKEFQLYFLPLFLLLLVPALAAMLPGLELRSAIVAVPIANLSVAVREVLTGRFDLAFLAITWLVSMAAAGAAGRAALRSLSAERLITAGGVDRAEHMGGAALLPRQVWRWFAAMWVVIFLVSLNAPQMQSLRRQVLFNLIVVFLGASLWIVRRYRLPWRQALAWRPVKPTVWLAVAIGAPAFHLAGLAVARLSQHVFPLPEGVLEEMSKVMLAAELPLWELLLLFAVLPGICEEIAFRGILLHALSRRFRPLPLCLLTGGVFALFHMELARLLPTAAIGVVLAALTLATGSIFPAMLWHALNNALAIVAGRAEVDLLALDPWAYAAAAVAAVLAVALVWQHRTVYPGLRSARRDGQAIE